MKKLIRFMPLLALLTCGIAHSLFAQNDRRPEYNLLKSSNFEIVAPTVRSLNQAAISDGSESPVGARGGNRWVVDTFYHDHKPDGSPYPAIPSQNDKYGDLGEISDPDSLGYLYIQSETAVEEYGHKSAVYDQTDPSSNFAQLDVKMCTHSLNDLKVQFFVLAQGSEDAYATFMVRKNEGPWAPIERYNNTDLPFPEDIKWQFKEYNPRTILEMSGVDILDSDCIEFGFAWENGRGQPDDIKRISFGVDDLRISGRIENAEDLRPNILVSTEIADPCYCTAGFRLSFQHDKDLCGGYYSIVMSAPGGDFSSGSITLATDIPVRINEDDCESIEAGEDITFFLSRNNVLPPLEEEVCYRFYLIRRTLEPPDTIFSDTTECVIFQDTCDEYTKVIKSPPIDLPTACNDLPDKPSLDNPNFMVPSVGEICKKSVIQVNFWSDGCFFEDNQYVAEISDSLGNFDNPATVNSIDGPYERHPEPMIPPGPGVVGGIMPSEFDNGDPIPPGCGYYFRVRSTNQVVPDDKMEPWGPFCIRDCATESNSETDVNDDRINIQICLDSDGNLVSPELTESLEDSCFLVPFTLDDYGKGVTYEPGNSVKVQLFKTVPPPTNPGTAEVLVDGEIATVDSVTGTGVMRICMPSLREMLFDPKYAGLLPPANFFFRIATDGASDSTSNCGTFNYFSFGITNAADSLQLNFLLGIDPPGPWRLTKESNAIKLCLDDRSHPVDFALSDNFWSQKQSSYEFYILATQDSLSPDTLENIKREFEEGLLTGSTFGPPQVFARPFFTADGDSIGVIRLLLGTWFDLDGDDTEGVSHVYVIAKERSGPCPANSATNWLRVDFFTVPQNPFTEFESVCVGQPTTFSADYLPNTAWFWYPEKDWYNPDVVEVIDTSAANNQRTFIFKEPGTYSVGLQIAHHCYNKFYDETIEVVPFPQIDMPDTVAACLGSPYQIYANMSNNDDNVETTWYWYAQDPNDEEQYNEVPFELGEEQSSYHNIRRAMEERRYKVRLTNEREAVCVDSQYVDLLIVEAEEPVVDPAIVCIGDAAEVEIDADAVEWDPNPALLAGLDAKNQLIAPDSSQIFRFIAVTQEHDIECKREGEVTVYVLRPEQDTLANMLLCGPSPIRLEPNHSDVEGAFYTWYEVYDSTRLSRVRSIDSFYVVNQPGMYQVHVRKDRQSEPCFEVTWNIDLIQLDPELEVELEACEGEELTLDPGVRGSVFLWNTGETTPTLNVSSAGIYKVNISSPDDSCSTTYNYLVTLPDECQEGILDVPNAFSPNNDGVNDFWRIWVNGLDKYTIAVYDRWGNQVHLEEKYREQFESMPDPNTGANYAAFTWDGRVDGGEPREGVYVYVIEAETVDGQEVQLVGTVTLVH